MIALFKWFNGGPKKQDVEAASAGLKKALEEAEKAHKARTHAEAAEAVTTRALSAASQALSAVTRGRNKIMTIRVLLYSFFATLLAYAAITYVLSADHVFHVFNAISLAAGVVVILAYFPGLKDAWRHRNEGVSAGHLLTFGVVFNWVGFTIRLGRWYFSEAQPASGFEQWAYNIGLWVSITAALFLTGAVGLSGNGWSRARWYAHGVVFIAIVCVLWYIDYAGKGLPHFGPIPLTGE